MAVTEQQFEQYMRMMQDAIHDGSLGSGRQSSGKSGASGISNSRDAVRDARERERYQRAETKLRKENEKAFTNYNKTLKSFSDDVSLYQELVAKSLKGTMEKMGEDAENLIPDALTSQLKDHAALFNNIQVSNFDEAMDFFDNIADKKALIESGAIQEYLADKTKVTAQQMDLLREVAEKDGKTIDQLVDSRTELLKQVDIGTELQANLNNELRKGKIGDLFDDSTKLKDGFNKLRTVVRDTAAAFSDSIAPALKYGTNWTDSFTSFMVGMKPEEMAQNVAQYRQSIRAAGISIDQFRDITETGTYGLMEYTGNMADGVKLQSSAFEAARRMGVSAADTGKFMEQQINSFKKFHKVFGLTTEEFIAMNKQIRDSSEINAQMYRLNKKQRSQAHLDIQQTILRLRTMGLMQDQAVKVVEAMSAIGAKSPKERLKQAAKLQAVGGAMGFGAEAGEAATLMRRGFNKAGDRERYAKLQQTMQQKTGGFMEQGLPQEMMAMQMLQKTGLEDVLGPKSAFQALNTQQYQATKNIEDMAVQENETSGRMLGALQMINTFLSSTLMTSLGSITALLAAIGAGKLLKGTAGKMLGEITASAAGSNLMKGILGSAVRLLGPAGIIATVVGLVGSRVAEINNAGKGFEHEKEATITDKVNSWFGGERDRADVQSDKANKRVIDAITKHIAAPQKAVEQNLRNLMPGLSREGRTSSRMGIDTIEWWDAENKEMIKGMSKTYFEFIKDAGEQARIKNDTQLHLVEERLKALSKEISAAAILADTETQKQRQKEYDKIEDNQKVLVDIKNLLADPNYKPVTDQLKINDGRQEARDEKALNANKKHTKIIWGRTSGETAG